MALKFDKLDFAVICALALAVVAYLKLDVLKELFAADDSALAVQSSSRDIVEVLRENKKDYLVVYASQTGTGEDYAKKFAKELAAKYSLNVMCVDVENYDFDNLNSLPKDVIVSFFVSTYGEGDLPDGGLEFEEWLQVLEEGDLGNVRYTMFGLGNSTYEFYNGAAEKTQKLLKQAGARMLGTFGKADDGAGTTDEDYMAWKDDILEELKDALALHEKEVSFISSYEYKVLPQDLMGSISLGEPNSQYLPGKTLAKKENMQLGPFDATHPYVAPITSTKELFKKKDRNCIHVEFDLSGSNLKYSTGDHLGVWPSNPDEKVEKFLTTFGLDPTTIFDLKPKDITIKPPFPVPTTIGAAVRYYLEISGPVSRQVIGSLLQYVTEEQLKERLQALSKNKEKYAKEITSKCMDLADALLYLSSGKKWTQVPWEFLIETVPHMQPRYYSISSSSSSDKQTVHITAVVENYPNPEVSSLGPVTGVTTNLLRHIHLTRTKEDIAASSLPVHYNLAGPRDLYQNYKLPVHVRRSTFRLPSNPSTPVIMVGPGTGVAPFRGFIRERISFLKNQENVKLGKHLLFYGCRDDADFLYHDEWPVYAKELGSSFELMVAYSRIPNKKKVYVQDHLLERENEVLELINKGAFIYVCGDAKGMSQDVHRTLIDILRRGKNISEEESSEILKQFKTTGKYQEDVW
ncbi:AAL121Cp [Eremothecium gossypii ATCC 10895]|uniref:NADPH--cytochrome P450 reductase n=1 Tax=Eremothecium gossypii (strain ATCC 10895 / CBS 109.51 / FGSC 9923 / NRRL Y-1056) TaxID=284811 RepID=Q75F49_EREGS|nr:AAL121Cp [Eremothecium gossypii ATCC 10895]AAS50245.1 AAL121Cp [Eremothecium gossypii ATCC 10895]